MELIDSLIFPLYSNLPGRSRSDWQDLRNWVRSPKTFEWQALNTPTKKSPEMIAGILDPLWSIENPGHSPR